MKKTLMLAGLIAAVSAMAQGTLNPANYATAIPGVPNSGVNSPFTIDASVDATTPKLWNGYVAQIFISATGTQDSMSAVGSLITFTGAAGKGTGLFLGKTMTFDEAHGLPAFAPGASVFVQVAVFPSTYGSFVAAIADPAANVGQSAILPITLGGSGTPPGPAANLAGLGVVTVKPIPEPSVIAPGLLGAGALLIRRRK